MRDRNSKIPLEEKDKNNIWDSFDDVLDVIKLAREGKWTWAYNPDCKYINVRIDMRDGGCIIFNNDDKRIDLKDLAYQWKEKE